MIFKEQEADANFDDAENAATDDGPLPTYSPPQFQPDSTGDFSQSRVSILDAPILLKPRPPPGFQPSYFTSPPRGRKPKTKWKYYVIRKGKCTGIYYGDWDDIKSLVEKVPGNDSEGFTTFERAKASYLQAKGEGNVCYIRDPGDAAKYGPDEDAVQ